MRYTEQLVCGRRHGDNIRSMHLNTCGQQLVNGLLASSVQYPLVEEARLLPYERLSLVSSRYRNSHIGQRLIWVNMTNQQSQAGCKHTYFIFAFAFCIT